MHKVFKLMNQLQLCKSSSTPTILIHVHRVGSSRLGLGVGVDFPRAESPRVVRLLALLLLGLGAEGREEAEEEGKKEEEEGKEEEKRKRLRRK